MYHIHDTKYQHRNIFLHSETLLKLALLFSDKLNPFVAF